MSIYKVKKASLYVLKEVKIIKIRQAPVLEEWQSLPSDQLLPYVDLAEFASLNQLEEEHQTDDSIKGKRRLTPGIRCGAALIAFVFCAYVVFTLYMAYGNPLPNLGFLKESAQLQQENSALTALKPAVTVIEGPNKNGSGFNIAPDGLIITNRHVVEGMAVVSVLFPAHGRYKGQNWQAIKGADLAIIDIDGKDLPYVPLSLNLPQLGEEVSIIGSPLGFDWTVAKGVVQSYIALEGYEKIMVIEGPIYSGSSGSPVFNSKGEVVAIVFAGFKDQPNLGLAIPVEALGILADLGKTKG